MDADPGIKHISDTALWVATYRARESARPNALFHDPLAERLAGARGARIAAAMPHGRIMDWILVVRTVAIDRLITRALALGVDTVLNLGAGLDTRPYRMQLPPTLHWVEVDFDSLIRYKSDRLAGAAPVCRLERVAADLSDVAARRDLFQRLGAQSRCVLVITEGVIIYLSGAEAAALSGDLYAIPSFRYWIQDYRQGGLAAVPQRVRSALGDSPFRYDEPDSIAHFQNQGWEVAENIYAADESLRIARPFPAPFPWNLLTPLLPGSLKERWRRSAGYIMYRKSERP
jgi:methyltransferase (TIGR00027 family)